MKQLEDLKATGITHLVNAARRGDHTIPQQMVDDYTQLEQLAADHTDRWGKVTDLKAIQAADKLADSLGRATAYGAATTLLVEYVQPALVDFLDQVRADLKAAGRHAAQPGATIDMLSESDDVRAAILRLNASHPKYGALRSSWQHLRRGSSTIDPLGLTSPLGEVSNLGDLVPDWEAAHYGRTPWPWYSTVFHIRMHWLLGNGAHVWLPTAAEQDAAWKRHHPEAKVAA